METITTDIFKASGTSISRTMFMLYGKPWLVGALLLVTPLIVLGCIHDMRWIVVALMAVFIVIPMVLAFLYLYYGMNKVSVINSTSHKFEFKDSGITSYIYKLTETITRNADHDSMDELDNMGYTVETRHDLMAKSEIPYSKIRGYVVGVSDVTLHTDESGKGFLLVPLSVFPDKDRFARAIDIMAAGMNKTA